MKIICAQCNPNKNCVINIDEQDNSTWIYDESSKRYRCLITGKWIKGDTK